jgi:GNAT superfamily N-acetyltransferase
LDRDVGTFTCTPMQSDAEVQACLPIMAQLRPQLGPQPAPAEWLARVRRMEGEGYRLAAARDAAGVAAVAGYRVFDCIARGGRSMYVDDLVTDEARRSRGAGKALLAWLIDAARSQGCRSFSLDSGVQRHAAHRFYMRERMNIIAYHFRIEL